MLKEASRHENDMKTWPVMVDRQGYKCVFCCNFDKSRKGKNLGLGCDYRTGCVPTYSRLADAGRSLKDHLQNEIHKTAFKEFCAVVLKDLQKLKNHDMKNPPLLHCATLWWLNYVNENYETMGSLNLIALLSTYAGVDTVPNMSRDEGKKGIQRTKRVKTDGGSKDADSSESESDDDSRDKTWIFETKSQRRTYFRKVQIQPVIKRNVYELAEADYDKILGKAAEGACQMNTPESLCAQHLKVVYTMTMDLVAINSFDSILHMCSDTSGMVGIAMHHTSPDAYKRYLNSINEVILAGLLCNVSVNSYYSLLVDECRDYGGIGQFSVYLKFVIYGKEKHTFSIFFFFFFF
jgi:hypothetical protein